MLNDKAKAFWVKGEPMKLINPEKLIEKHGFFVEDEKGWMVKVVTAQDIRNAPGVEFAAVVPGNYEALKTELQFTRQFIHNHGLEFELASEWKKAGHSGSAVEEKRGHWITHTIGLNTWAECSECLTCGSPHWKVCPVCEAKMEETCAEE